MVTHRGKKAIGFDGYELAAIESYRDKQEQRTGRRPSFAGVLRALVREWAGLSDVGTHRPDPRLRRTQPPSSRAKSTLK